LKIASAALELPRLKCIGDEHHRCGRQNDSRAREPGFPLVKFTEQFKQAFLRRRQKTLRTTCRPNFRARPTQQLHRQDDGDDRALIRNDSLIQADDKSVYFRINKFPG